jgi:F420-0:gamma-glutamyl ligase
MHFIPIKTKKLYPPQENLYPVLDKYLPALKERDILFITSKILSIHQGRCVKISNAVSKDELILKEAEYYLPRNQSLRRMFLTIKNNTLIPAAGIDESNANGYYILWPKEINAHARKICTYLKKKHNIKKLAVIVTDSHTIPLRSGVLGISIGFFGLHPLKDYRGKPDIFGRTLRITKTNIVDALAAIGVLVMGEGRERTPMAIARGVNCVKFTNKNTAPQITIPRNKDIYAPLLRVFDQKQKRDYTTRMTSQKLKV